MLGFLLIVGCAGPTVHGPGRTVAPSNPARDVQVKLLKDARSLQDQGQGPAAVRLLERWLQTYPDSPLLPEARWRLAQAYEQAGNLPAALAQYRQVARLAWDSEQGRGSRSRMAELERALQAPPARNEERTVVFLASERLPPGLNLGAWLAGLARAGVTGVGVTAGTEAEGAVPAGRPDAASAGPASGVFFQTDWAPMTRDVIGQLVPAAHRHGLSVYVGVNLHRMDWVDPELGWRDRGYDPVVRQMKPAAGLDLFHPSYQEYLIGLLKDLAGTGVDGVLFRAGPAMRAGEGLSPYAVLGFQKDFGVTLDPDSVLRAAPPAAVRSPGTEAPPEVWRWFGWRSRERLRVMDRLKQAMRQRAPAMRIGLELHAAAATDPVTALVLYQEDLLEAKRGQWDFYVMQRDPAAGAAPGSGVDAGTEQTGLAVRTAALLENGGKVWLGMPLWTNDPVRLSERLALAMDHAAFPSGVGLWYVAGPAPVP